jgi:hypothetical protein
VLLFLATTTISAFVIKDLVQQPYNIPLIVPSNNINNNNRISRCKSLFFSLNHLSITSSYTLCWYLKSMFNDNNDIDNNEVLQIQTEQPLPSSTTKTAQSDDNMLFYSDVLPQPNPSYNAIHVVQACMETIVQNQQYDPNIGLQVCYNFSNDRCRSAIGADIQEFYLYAQNPIFQHITYCRSYNIISIGPIISGTNHRGAMQTILIDVLSSKSNNNSNRNMKPSSTTSSSSLNTKTSSNNNTPQSQQQQQEEKYYRFLWTLQQERRPPYQNCWFIHEVLYTKNAYHHTI